MEEEKKNFAQLIAQLEQGGKNYISKIEIPTDNSSEQTEQVEDS